ncbi:MAG: S49 family peptidase [Alphaproteobacteria bacterium]|nr:S49 family peptidase [Alphaproteobacteria bacterium]
MIRVTNRPLLVASEYLEPTLNFEWIPKGTFVLSEYSIDNGVAVIPVYGLLTKRSERFYYTTNYDDIYLSVSRALHDDKVESLLLDIDSPGGEVGGLFDLVDFIYGARDKKPIYAYANDSAFSAAYAIASACSRIFVNRTSGVGSIGVIATHTDISEADKKLGVKYTTIFAGEEKNDLTPHEPLSKNAKDKLQREVNRLYEMFLSTVARNRNLDIEKIRKTQAATYYGENAIEVGLADEITCNPWEEIMKKEKKMEEKNEEEIEKYRAEILEIAQLCKLAHAERKLAKFIEQKFTVDQVKEALLNSMDAKEEISSHVYHKEMQKENPVIAAAKQRAGSVTLHP